MNKTLKRAAITTAAAGMLGAGALTAAAPAHADVPNLHTWAATECKLGLVPGAPWTNGVWTLTRTLGVTAQGMDFKHVNLQEINGAHKSTPKLEKGKSLVIQTIWRGCAPGQSISGYAWGAEQENPLDNFAFAINWKVI